jgi:hypothetical protein
LPPFPPLLSILLTIPANPNTQVVSLLVTRWPQLCSPDPSSSNLAAAAAASAVLVRLGPKLQAAAKVNDNLHPVCWLRGCSSLFTFLSIFLHSNGTHLPFSSPIGGRPSKAGVLEERVRGGVRLFKIIWRHHCCYSFCPSII